MIENIHENSSNWEIKQTKSLNFHTNYVNCMEIYRNEVLITASDNLILFTDWTNDHKVIKELKIHNAPVTYLTLYYDILISGCEDKVVNITDLKKNFQLIQNCSVTSGKIKSLKIYQDFWVIASNELDFLYWKNYRHASTFKFHTNEILSIVVYKDFLISSDWDKKLLISNWVIDEQTPPQELDIHSDIVTCMIILKDILITGSKDSTIKLTDWINDYEIIKEWDIHTELITCLKLYKDFLISGSEDKTIKITDWKNNYEIIKELNLHSNLIICINIYNDFWISASKDKSLKLTDWKNSYNIINEKVIHIRKITCMVLYQDKIISGSEDKSIKITDWKNNYEIIKELKIHSNSIKCLCVYKDLLISGSDDKSIKVTNWKKNYEVIKILNIHNNFILSMVIYKNYWISSSKDNTVKITNWDKNFELIKELNNKVNCMIIYNNILISGSEDKSINLMKLNSYTVIKKWNIHSEAIRCLNLYKDWLITSSNNSIIITNWKNKYEFIKELEIHSNLISCMVIYKNFLISGSKDKVIKITDLINNNFTIKEWKINSQNICCLNIFEEQLISNSNNSIKVLNLKKNTNKLLISPIINDYYLQLNDNEKKLDLNLNILYNLIYTSDEYTNEVVFNHYFKIHSNIIKKTHNIELFIQSLTLFKYDILYNKNNINDNLINIIIKENKIIFLMPLLKYFLENNIFYQIESYEKFISIFKLIKNDTKLFELLLNNVLIDSITDPELEEKKLIGIKSDIVFKSKSNYFTKNLFNKYINKNKTKDLLKYEIKNFSFKIPNLLSQNKKLFNIINEASDQIKISDIKYWINYFFNGLFLFKYLNLLIFLVLIVSLIIFLNLNDTISKFVYIWSIIYFLFYEIVQFLLNFKNYFKELGNLFDLGLIIYNLVVFYFIFNNQLNKINLYVMILFYWNGIKCLNFLKSIEFIRKQIRLFFKVFIFTFTFIIFIFIILFYLATINFLFNFQNAEDYKLSVFRVYGMMLGTFDDDYPGYSTQNYIELVINTYIFNIILLNLFISIIAEVFNDYNENKELYDIEEKLSIILEYASMYKFFNYVQVLFKKISPNFTFSESYFFIIKKNEFSEDNLNDQIENLKEDLNSQMTEINKKIDSNDIKINNKIDKNYAQMKENIEELKSMVAKVK